MAIVSRMDRTAKIMTGIQPGTRVLEIGPCFAPIVPKSQFQNVLTLDHGSQAELIEKYTPHGVDTSRIEPVDFVWHSGPIHSCIPEDLHGTFDAVIASHVLEHVPDPISWLQSFDVLLKPHGIVSLAVPDKRYTFDFFKPLSTTADLIEAFEEKRSRHTRRALLINFHDSVKNNGAAVWGTQLPLGKIEFINSGEAGLFPIGATDEYVDTHAWFFVPSSFDLLILELRRLGLIPFSLGHSYASEGCEFFRILHRSPTTAADIDAERLRLHYAARKEIFDNLLIRAFSNR